MGVLIRLDPTRAEPLYAKAGEAFMASGDERNALYAEVNRLRGQLPTLPVPEVSGQASGLSRSWRHNPSSPWYASSDAIMRL